MTGCNHHHHLSKYNLLEETHHYDWIQRVKVRRFQRRNAMDLVRSSSTCNALQLEGGGEQDDDHDHDHALRTSPQQHKTEEQLSSPKRKKQTKEGKLLLTIMCNPKKEQGSSSSAILQEEQGAPSGGRPPENLFAMSSSSNGGQPPPGHSGGVTSTCSTSSTKDFSSWRDTLQARLVSKNDKKKMHLLPRDTDVLLGEQPEAEDDPLDCYKVPGGVQSTLRKEDHEYKMILQESFLSETTKQEQQQQGLLLHHQNITSTTTSNSTITRRGGGENQKKQQEETSSSRLVHWSSNYRELRKVSSKRRKQLSLLDHDYLHSRILAKGVRRRSLLLSPHTILQSFIRSHEDDENDDLAVVSGAIDIEEQKDDTYFEERVQEIILASLRIRERIEREQQVINFTIEKKRAGI